MVRGRPAGPDGAGGAFQNDVESERAGWWHALGGAQGVIKGFTHAGVAGQMALDFTLGAALVGERAVDGTASLDRGYLVWADSTTRVTFAPASAAARNDAVIACFADVEDGALGTGVTQVGPQIIVVTGVSGTTTPRTDAQINAALGRGGWVRLMDVPIAATDTQINVANIVKTTASYKRVSSGHVRVTADQAFGNATGVPVTGMGVDLSPGTYVVEAQIVTNADTAAGIQFTWTIPTGTAYTFTAVGPNNLLPAGTASNYDGEWIARVGTGAITSVIPVGSTTGVPTHTRLRLEVVITTAGTVQLNAAQQRDDTGSSRVLAGSSMEWRRVA